MVESDEQEWDPGSGGWLSVLEIYFQGALRGVVVVQEISTVGDVFSADCKMVDRKWEMRQDHKEERAQCDSWRPGRLNGVW